jgi:Ran GTPase-activating protein (RanGAP) involved in mRNA processing and transport
MYQSAFAQMPLPQFSDSNLQSCFAEQAARNGWTVAEDVTTLSCANRGIVSMNGVDVLANLTDLDLSNNPIDQVWPLTRLNRLKRLNLAGNTKTMVNDLRQAMSSLPALTSLNLSGINIGSVNNLNGLMDPATWQPRQLIELELANTHLTDTQNGKSLDFLSRVTTLKKLNVAGNGITNPWGAMASRDLEEFDLSNSDLPFPGNLPQFTNLKKINLSGNRQVTAAEVARLISQNPGLTSIKLSGVAIGNISNLGPLPVGLTELDLGNTGVRDVNGAATLNFLQPLVNLRSLNLANNGILDATALLMMAQLEALDLSGNQLAALGNLGQLHNLTSLNLSGNRSLNFGDVANLLAGNPKLNRIGLNGLRIGQNTQWLGAIGSNGQQAGEMLELDLGNTGVDVNSLSLLQAMPNLQRLNLAGNGFSSETRLTFLSNAQKLQALDLSNNGIVDVYPLFGLTQLRKLNLSNTAVRGSDVRALLDQNQNLTSIGLNGIAIGNISNLGDLRNRQSWQPYDLTELDLGNTGLQGTNGNRGFDFLRQFPNLQNLNLAGNGIEDMPELASLEALRELDLSNNRLLGLGFGNQTGLTRLNLSDNRNLRVQEIAYLIDRNPGLQSLGLNGMAIGSFSNLGPLTDYRTGQAYNLTELDLGNTGLLDQSGQKNIEFLSRFVNLQRLNLAGNGLADVRVIGSFAALRDLDLSGNAVSDASVFAGLRNLERLNLSGNVAIPAQQLRPLLDQFINLTSLGLNGIALRDFSALGSLQNPQTGRPYDLRELDLGNTQLAANGNGNLFWLAMFPNLQRLNLAGAGLNSLQGLEGFSRMTALDVSDNTLFDLQPLYAMRGLTRLNLSGNVNLQSWTIGQVLGQNPGLTHIGLNRIALGSLDNIGAFGGSWQPMKLVELDIGNTGLRNIDGLNFLSSFPGITRLNVAGNELRSINGVHYLPGLKHLDASNNALGYVLDLGDIRTLQTLNLAGNSTLKCYELNALVSRLPGAVVTRPNLCDDLNQPPSAWAGNNQSVTEGGNVTLSGSGYDVDGTIASYAWVQTAGPGVTLAAPTSAISGFAAPTVTADTVFSFQLTVLDDKGASASSSTNVTVKPKLNLPPTVSVGANQTVFSGDRVNLSGTASDPDGSIATYSWIQINSGPALYLYPQNTANSGFTAPVVTADTVFTLVLTVADNRGASNSATTQVTVKPKPNLPPVASAGANQSVASGSNVSLTGSGTDSDGTIASYNWVQTAGPAVVLNTPKAATSGFVAPILTSDTVLTFQLTVLDNKGASASSTTNVTVKAKPNLPPVVNAGAAQSVVGGASVTLAGSATDSDGSIASYKWVQTAGPTVTLATPLAASTTFLSPVVTSNTICTFQLTAVDNRGASVATSVNVTLTPKLGLSANAGAAQTVNEGAAVILSGSGSSGDGASVYYDWVQIGGPSVSMGSYTTTGIRIITPQVNADTVLTFRLNVYNRSGSTFATTTVTVKDTGPTQNVPDLAVTDARIPSFISYVGRGNSLSVSTTTANKGLLATTVSTNTGIYLTRSPNSVKTTDYLLTSTPVRSNMLRGGTDLGDATVTMPWDVAPGEYYIGVIADYNNMMAESIETNNTYVIPQKIIVY